MSLPAVSSSFPVPKSQSFKVPQVLWRKKVCAAKARFELELPGLVGEDSKKRFFKCIRGKRQCKNNIGLFWDGDGHLTDGQRDLTHPLSLSSTWMMEQGGPSALSWRVMTESGQFPINPEFV